MFKMPDLLDTWSAHTISYPRVSQSKFYIFDEVLEILLLFAIGVRNRRNSV
jgi:hypothetical protein